MKMKNFSLFYNGQAQPLNTLPLLAPGVFREAVLHAVQGGARAVAQERVL